VPIVSKYTAIAPVLNRSCVTFKGPRWWLSDKVQFRALTADEIRLLTENASAAFDTTLTASSKAIIIDIDTTGPYERIRLDIESYVFDVLLSVQTVLNIAASRGAIAIPLAFIVGSAFTKRIRSILEQDLSIDRLHIRDTVFRIGKQFTRDDIKALFRLVIESLRVEDSLHITMQRFCASLMHRKSTSRAIDLSIALESMIPGGGEFGFRFPFYLSQIASQSGIDRKLAYNLYNKLYLTRCKIVHGDTVPQKIKLNDKQWIDLIKYSKQCLLQRISCIENLPQSKWKKSLLEVALKPPAT
jgi:hypothetical protein